MKIGSGKIFPILLIAFALLMPLEPAAQNNRGNGKKEETKDSLLTLLNAEYARVFQLPGGREYREVKGPAVFLHNGAYLFCDSAIWNLSYNRIEAYKNVKIVQDKTVITGDNLNYYADDNVAKFRGDLVEVSDEKHNMLRTRYLDYNTKDSVALFFFGGAMQSEKGEIIEGDRGNYDAKTGLFNFKDNVEMFTDSLFMKSSKLDYDTNINKAFFGKNTHLWKNDYYMRANDGWYARDTGVVFFNDGVYMNDPDYESWCDSLYFYQHENKGDMFGNVQLLDSLNNTFFLSDKAHTETDSVGNLHAFLFDRAASINIGENQQHQIDTLFCRADTMYFHTERVCDIPSSIISESEEFKTSIMFDAIAEADRKALEKKEADRQSAIEQLPEYKAYKKRLELAEKDSLEKAIARMKAEEEAELAGGNAAAEPQNAAQEGSEGGSAEGAAVNPAANPEGGAAVAAEGSPESAEGAEAATNEAAAEGGA
ncbi:MAG: hypothetical protein HUJ91_06055, partial [Bacteroidales bacterium]|nr:hypothetical protein [Bacteroidales bacterium]